MKAIGQIVLGDWITVDGDTGSVIAIRHHTGEHEWLGIEEIDLYDGKEAWTVEIQDINDWHFHLRMVLSAAMAEDGYAQSGPKEPR
jgi:hypothetical protein